jgi:hypothetical protein
VLEGFIILVSPERSGSSDFLCSPRAILTFKRLDLLKISVYILYDVIHMLCIPMYTIMYVIVNVKYIVFVMLTILRANFEESCLWSLFLYSCISEAEKRRNRMKILFCHMKFRNFNLVLNLCLSQMSVKIKNMILNDNRN